MKKYLVFRSGYLSECAVGGFLVLNCPISNQAFTQPLSRPYHALTKTYPLSYPDGVDFNSDPASIRKVSGIRIRLKTGRGGCNGNKKNFDSNNKMWNEFFIGTLY